MYPRTEMLDLVVVDGKAQGIVTRDIMTGKIELHGDAVVLATGGYGNVFYFLRMPRLQCYRLWRAHHREPSLPTLLYAIHPTCIPVSGEHQSKLTLMSESLRNDGRIWVPTRKATNVTRHIPEGERDYYLERIYPASVTWFRAT